MVDAVLSDLTPRKGWKTVHRKAGLPPVYVAFWMLAATASTAYIGFSTAHKQSEIAIGLASPQSIGNSSLARSTLRQPAGPAPAMTEAQRLRRQLAEYQSDLAQFRTDLEGRNLDTRVVAGLIALEERMSMTTAIAPLPSAPARQPALSSIPGAAMSSALSSSMAQAPGGNEPRAQSQQGPAKPSLETQNKTSPVVEVPAAPAPHASSAPVMAAVAADVPGTVTPDQTGKPIETGTLGPAKIPSPLNKSPAAQAPKLLNAPLVSTTAAIPVAPAAQAVIPAPAAAIATPAEPAPAAPISFGPPVVKAEPKPVAVQLGSSTSLDTLRLNWSLLTEQHADSLRNLQPRYTSTGTPEAGKLYDLVAGPIKSTAEAKRVCKALAARGFDCKVAAFAGDAL